MGKVYGVLHTQIETIWPDVRTQLLRALEYSDGKYDEAAILKSLLARDMQLWLYVKDQIDACVVTQIVNYPNKKVCSILFVGGNRMHEWICFNELIEQWARENSCDAIEIYGRPGWERVLGWERIHIVIRKNLHESTH